MSLDVFPIPSGIYFGRKNYSPVAQLHSRTMAEFKLEIRNVGYGRISNFTVLFDHGISMDVGRS